jgi:hypothetical protein
MRAETSKEPEKHSSQLSRRIAEGKRKGESYGQALSLQDVLSDSGNTFGSSQQTYLPFDTERRKGAQLEGNSIHKTIWIEEDSNKIGRK